jgi:hypothetical protein
MTSPNPMWNGKYNGKSGFTNSNKEKPIEPGTLLAKALREYDEKKKARNLDNSVNKEVQRRKARIVTVIEPNWDEH